ncbi:MAG: site-specific integrase [Planctomycetes bacterium]|nr:site-specific integrase [Planctomycetota bacterium]
MREITVSLVGPETVPKRGDPDRRVWRARYVDRQGRRRAQTIGDARKVSRVKAEKLVRSMEREFARDSTKVERLKRVTVAELVERYIEAKSPTWKVATKKQIEESAGHLMAVVSPRKLVRDFTIGDASAVLRHLRKPVDKNGRTRSKSTVKKHVTRLSSLFTWATRREQKYIHENPFDSEQIRDAKRAKVGGKHFEPFGQDEIAAILAACPSVWWEAFVRLGLGSGLRLAELCHLQWDDLDLQLGAGRVRVTAKAAGEFEIDGQTYPFLPWESKSHHNRTVPVSDEVVEAMLRLRDSADADGSPYVFLKLTRLGTLAVKLRAGTLRDNYQVVNNVLTRFQQIQRRAYRSLGGRHRVATVHDMRKSYGTTMAHAGVPLVVLCRWMGHSSVKVTEQFYIGVDDSWDAHARLVTPGKPNALDPSSTLCLSEAMSDASGVDANQTPRYRQAV